MAVPYRNMEEISDRMYNSVCILDGEPVYVTGRINTMGDGVLAPGYFKLPYEIIDGGMNPARRLAHTPITDPGWSVRDFNIGYMNNVYKGRSEAVYLTRIPVRGAGYKNGLTRENLSGFTGSGTSFTGALNSQSFKDMLLGKYPALATVRRTLTNNNTIAFSKHLALSISELDTYFLYYRGRRVATSLDGTEFKLSKQHEYLRETLEEQKIRMIPA